METASHRAGSTKGGKSRFSKALPAPPLVAPSSPPSGSSLPQHLPPTPRKHLPTTTPPPTTQQAPSTSTPQSLPKSLPQSLPHAARTMAAVAPAPPPTSSLPVLPPLPQKNMTMAIPRRPVGGTQVSPAQISPVTSISSSVSAFSTESSAPSQSSSATASTVDTASMKGSRSIASNSMPPPALPPKDPARTQHRTIPQRPLSPVSPSRSGPWQGPSLTDALMDTPPRDSLPKPQIWRRRSMKSNKSLDVTELQLNESNGSTMGAARAASEQNSPHEDAHSKPLPPPRDSASPRPAPPKTAALAGAHAFPGRNIKPEASPARAQNAAHNTVPVVYRSQSPAARLPTPDYGKDDVQSLVVEDARSPDSPAASPKLPFEVRPAQATPASDAIQTIPRKAVGATSSEQAVRAVKTTPGLTDEGSDTPAPPSLPPDGTSTRTTMPWSPLGSPGSPFPRDPRTAQDSSEPSRFPLRMSSRAPEDNARPEQLAHGGLQVPIQRQAMGYGHPEHIKPVSAAGSGSTASDDTLRPGQQPIPLPTSAQQKFLAPAMSPSELRPINEALAQPNIPDEATTTDNPGAALFPRNWYEPTANDGVLNAVPLKKIHFDCLHKHRTMFPSSQQYNPISCATCGKKETKPETRYWSCACCHLRVCGVCRNELHQCFRGNLQALVDDLERRALMGLYQMVPGEGVYDATHEESAAMGMNGGAAVVQAAAVMVGPV